jgi:hypothetical protein
MAVTAALPTLPGSYVTRLLKRAGLTGAGMTPPVVGAGPGRPLLRLRSDCVGGGA